LGRCDADVGQTAQAALDQASKKVLILGTTFAEEEVGLERLLRLVPGCLGHDGRDWPRGDWPLADGPLAELVNTHVGLVGNQPANPAGTPYARRSLLSLSPQGEAIISNVGAGNAEIVQSGCDHSAGFPLDRRHPENILDHFGLGHG
jgi:hypothetical protein